MGMQVVNQDQYTPATYYGEGTHTLTREVIGTRYAIAVVRFLVDFSNKEDVRQVHALQDAIKFNQARLGTFEIPHWDEASLKKIKAALLQLGTTVSDTRRIFGANENEVDPIRHLIGSAMLWGGYPEGYLEPNQYNAYAVNDITANKGTDGSAAIQFGGCDGEIPNCLPIMKGWNYTVRLFLPRPEILNGTWRFPEAQPVS